MNQKNCWIFGATGLIGGHLLDIISQNETYDTIHVFSRREIDFQHPKVMIHIIDFADLEAALTPLEAGDIFCCLGTTMKKAGSKEAFKFVDYHLPTEIARIGKQKGANKYLLVSSMGADKDSMFFYNQVKGETENEIKQKAFPHTFILRPSLLLGERNESRTGEDVGKIVMKVLNPLFIGPMRQYKAIQGKDVAKAMLNIAQQIPEQSVFLSDEIQSWAEKE